MRIALQVLFAWIVLTSCGTNTSISDSWKDPALQPRTFAKIGVLAITGQPGNRRMAESALASALSDEGLNAMPTYELFPDQALSEGIPRQKLIDELKAAGIDGVLTASVIDVREETHYNPGTTYNPMGYGYYGGLYPYYSRYGTVYDPGYYTQNTNFIIETNLYGLEEEGLIWSAHTKTIDPVSVSAAAQSFGSRVVKQLQKDKVLLF